MESVKRKFFFKKQRDTVMIPKGKPGFVKEDHSKLDFERRGNFIKNVAALFKKDGSLEWRFKYIDMLKKDKIEEIEPSGFWINCPDR